jgi:hypothetical protein
MEWGTESKIRSDCRSTPTNLRPYLQNIEMSGSLFFRREAPDRERALGTSRCFNLIIIRNISLQLSPSVILIFIGHWTDLTPILNYTFCLFLDCDHPSETSWLDVVRHRATPRSVPLGFAHMSDGFSLKYKSPSCVLRLLSYNHSYNSL